MRTLIGLLTSSALFMLCLGAATPAVSLRLEAAGWSHSFLSLTLGTHHIGFAAVAIFGTSMLTHLGARKALLLASLSLAFGTFLQAGWTHPLNIAFGRAIGGAAVALTCITVEPGIGRIGGARRGTLLGLYLVSSNLSYSLGSALSGYELWSLVLATLAALCICMPASLLSNESPFPCAARVELGPICTLTPDALIAALCGGATTTTLLVVTPLQGLQLGLSPTQNTIYVTLIAAMGALVPTPMGLLADRGDRRKILRQTVLWAAILALISAWVQTPILSAIALAASAGACFSLYPLGFGWAQSQIDPESFARGAGALLLAAATGSVIGAPIAGGFLASIGPAALPLWIAIAASLSWLGIHLSTKKSGRESESSLGITSAESYGHFRLDLKARV